MFAVPVVLLLTAILLSIVPASAEDLAPPSWRGQPRTTFQQWEFSTSANPATPDAVSNPYGSVAANIGAGTWSASYLGRDGVWGGTPFGMYTSIPNAEGGDYKNFWVQVTWAPSKPDEFPLYSILGLSPVSTSTTALQNGWYFTTWQFLIIPNPSQEMFELGGNIYVDELVIDTRCVVPEPASLLVLGSGVLGLAGMVRRRGK